MANERTTWKDAFKMADQVLYMGVRGVTDLMMAPGLVNLDFADIRTVMAEMGKAMMGTGEADGDNRAIRAAEAAISNPLLEDTSMSGARGLLINITGGDDLTLFEVDQAANRIREEVDEEANIIFGSAIDPELQGRIRVSVVATGIDTPIPAEKERPRLVAVNGGAMPAPAPIPLPMHATGGGQGLAVAMSAGSGGGSSHAHALRHPAPQVVAGGEALSANGPMAEALQAVAAAVTPVQKMSATLQALGVGPAAAHQVASRAASSGGSLFADPSRPVSANAPSQPVAAESLRPSLFSTVTGAFRRRPQPSAAVSSEPAQARAEPVIHEQRPEQPQVSVHQTAGDEVTGLDIPAFLRRQSS
jgi:cell division protein FtsZ